MPADRRQPRAEEGEGGTMSNTPTCEIQTYYPCECNLRRILAEADRRPSLRAFVRTLVEEVERSMRPSLAVTREEYR